jgi:hypothetical protein
MSISTVASSTPTAPVSQVVPKTPEKTPENTSDNASEVKSNNDANDDANTYKPPSLPPLPPGQGTRVDQLVWRFNPPVDRWLDLPDPTRSDAAVVALRRLRTWSTCGRSCSCLKAGKKKHCRANGPEKVAPWSRAIPAASLDHRRRLPLRPGANWKPGRASEKKPGRMAPEVAALNIGCIDGVELTRRAIILIDKHNRWAKICLKRLPAFLSYWNNKHTVEFSNSIFRKTTCGMFPGPWCYLASALLRPGKAVEKSCGEFVG